MRNTDNKKIEKRSIGLTMLLTFLLSLTVTAVYYLLQVNTSIEYGRYLKKYKTGMICEDNLSFSEDMDLLDEKATETLRLKNRDEILPVFVFSIDRTSGILGSIDELRLTSGKENFGAKEIAIAYEISKTILSEGLYDVIEVEEVRKTNNSISVLNGLSDNENRTIVATDELLTELTLDERINRLLEEYSDIELDSGKIPAIKTIVEKNCQPNVLYDRILTEFRRNEAFESTLPVVTSFRKGQSILVENKVITDEQIELLKNLSNNRSVSLVNLVSTCVFSFIGLCLILSVLLYIIRNSRIYTNQTLILVFVFTLIMELCIYFGQLLCIELKIPFSEIFIPICLLPVGISMITGKKTIGLVCVFITEFAVSFVPGNDLYTYFYIILCGIAGLYSIRFMNSRLDSFKQCLMNLATTSALTVIFMLLRAVDFALIGKVFLVIGANVVGTHLFLIILLPLLERLFNLPTTFRLHELAYGDSPLIEKLSKAAPGTYNHSRNVAELADSACREIKANALLARVGALYHDIGKVDYPEYFVENQSGENLHEDLNPSLSISIIKNHVKAGADKGREAGLPAEVIDIIANHHGNDVISYFYNEAKKQTEGDQKVSSIDFSYNNSELPRSKECAIVMLADGVEAAARTIQNPTPAKFAKVINNIVYGKISRGQLRHCIISMEEIDKVCDSFLKSLTAIHHARIQYPDEEKK